MPTLPEKNKHTRKANQRSDLKQQCDMEECGLKCEIRSCHQKLGSDQMPASTVQCACKRRMVSSFNMYIYIYIYIDVIYIYIYVCVCVCVGYDPVEQNERAPTCLPRRLCFSHRTSDKLRVVVQRSTQHRAQETTNGSSCLNQGGASFGQISGKKAKPGRPQGRRRSCPGPTEVE